MALASGRGGDGDDRRHALLRLFRIDGRSERRWAGQRAGRVVRWNVPAYVSGEVGPLARGPAPVARALSVRWAGLPFAVAGRPGSGALPLAPWSCLPLAARPWL